MTTMLSPPLVVEPVTPCAKRVRVQNLLPGADVKVFADDLFVGRATADGPEIAVLLFRKVSTGMKLVATQSLGGETSDVSPEGDRKPSTYAPYAIDRWTRFDRSRRWLELVYTLSSERSDEGLGYEPQLMRTFLAC